MEDAHKSRVLRTHLFIVASVPSARLFPFIRVSYQNAIHSTSQCKGIFTVSRWLIGIYIENTIYFSERSFEGQGSPMNSASSGHRLMWYHCEAQG